MHKVSPAHSSRTEREEMPAGGERGERRLTSAVRCTYASGVLRGSTSRDRGQRATMAADVLVSLGLVAGIVALSHVTRNVSSKALADTGLSSYAVELVSTFQLCCCAHELKLLSEVGGIAPGLALTLTYLVTVVHVLTLSGAVGNPSGTLENAYHRRISCASALRQIACQFTAAIAARAAARQLWDLGLSGLHVQHKLHGFRCVSPIHAPLPQAAAVEFLCAFAVQMVITHASPLKERYRVHAIAAIITAVVYAGTMSVAVHDTGLSDQTGRNQSPMVG